MSPYRASPAFPARTGVTGGLPSPAADPGGIPKNPGRDPGWVGNTVTEEVTTLAPELDLGRETNSFFLLHLGQRRSRVRPAGKTRRQPAGEGCRRQTSFCLEPDRRSKGGFGVSNQLESPLACSHVNRGVRSLASTSLWALCV